MTDSSGNVPIYLAVLSPKQLTDYVVPLSIPITSNTLMFLCLVLSDWPYSHTEIRRYQK